MKKIREDIHYREEKIDEYAKEVVSLLGKRQYGTFLIFYIKLLHDELIRYNELVMVWDDEQENIEKDKENETAGGNPNKYRWW